MHTQVKSSQACERGFTLIELVVAMTISAIVVGFVVMFMTAPVDAYFDQAERAVLNDAAQSISRSMLEDLNTALPNSVRIRNVGTRSIVEMLKVDSISYYLPAGSLGAVDRELDFAATDTYFSAFGRIDPSKLVQYDFPGRMVVSNRGTGAAATDAYQSPPVGVITPLGTIIRVTPNIATNEDAVQLLPGYRFTAPAVTVPPTRQRLFLVSTPVTYICNSAANARTLHRYTKYPITQTIPTTEASLQLNGANVVNSTLATNIASCRTRCQGGAANVSVCLNTIVIEITVDRPTNSGNETLRIFEQVPLDNEL